MVENLDDQRRPLHGAGHGHGHDPLDWASRLDHMRRADALAAPFLRPVARRLIGLLGVGRTVVDFGPGAGGMSALLAAELAATGGGELVLVDLVPEVLAAAEAHVRSTVDTSVEVRAVRVDAAVERVADQVAGAALIWAAGVVHHLPDQQQGIADLVACLGPGWLALAEGGLATRCLPFDVGVGEPGLVDRLAAAQRAWFAEMRAATPGVVRLPVGWNAALTAAGLDEVTAFSYLVDLPAPAGPEVRAGAVDWLRHLAGVGADRLDDADRAALAQLTDPDDTAYAGVRDDVFVLSAQTVHLGRKHG
jgi:SAM-dependent methyltransferase